MSHLHLTNSYPHLNGIRIHPTVSFIVLPVSRAVDWCTPTSDYYPSVRFPPFLHGYGSRWWVLDSFPLHGGRHTTGNVAVQVTDELV